MGEQEEIAMKVEGLEQENIELRLMMKQMEDRGKEREDNDKLF